LYVSPVDTYCDVDVSKRVNLTLEGKMNQKLFDQVGLVGYVLVTGRILREFIPTQNELVKIFLGAKDKSALQRNAINRIAESQSIGPFWLDLLGKCAFPESKNLVVDKWCLSMTPEEWYKNVSETSRTCEFTKPQLSAIKDINQPLEFWWKVNEAKRYSAMKNNDAESIIYKRIISLSKTQDDWLRVLREKITSLEKDKYAIVLELLDLNTTFAEQLQLFITIIPIDGDAGRTVLKAMATIGTFEDWKNFVENGPQNKAVSDHKEFGIANAAAKAEKMEQWAFVFNMANMHSDSWEKARKALADLSK
jgi:hypothetical protein